MMNLLIGVFNLLPGTPLDGGRLLHGLIWRLTGDRRRATRGATSAGQVLGALLAGFGVVLAITGRLEGLWLVLMGWFIGGSAVGERAHATIVASFAGLTVGDVMSTAPVVVPDSWTVREVLRHLAGPEGSRHRAFPVVDRSGRPLGVIGLADLVAVPSPSRPHTAVHDLVRTPPLVLAPTDPLERVLEAPPTSGRDLVVVSDGNRVVGVVSAGDLERVVLLRPEVEPTSTP
jgi:CBS domain-containing protein